MRRLKVLRGRLRRSFCLVHFILYSLYFSRNQISFSLHQSIPLVRFIVVIGTILLGFAVCFRVLLGQNNEDFATFGTALFSMFDVGVLGDFDRSAFKDSENPILTMALFIILLIVVLIVAMSGFVLILESSLEDVRENEEANRKYQRARIIIDYMKLLSSKSRARLLGQRKFFFALVPVDHEDAIGADVSKESFIKRKRMWRKTITN